MQHRVKNSESGVALLSALFAVLLLSAIALGLVYVAGTESQVNYNYRNEQIAYFAAKAGVEEARDRMMPSNANYFGGSLPTLLPGNGVSPGILYLLNEGAPANAGTVQPWSSTNAYFDDELCHDGYNLGLTQVQPDLRCNSAPGGGNWYNKVTSTAPWNGTSAAMAYKWVRIAPKVNGTEQDYAVVPINSVNSGTQICWDGSYERLLTAATCQQMQTPQNTSMTPVYVLTALAVAPNGARKMVQAEVAQAPSQGFIYGMYAAGTGCSILELAGGAITDSFTTANGGTYATTHTNTGGDVGSNGNVDLEGTPTQVGGSIGVLAVPPAAAASQGPCPQNNYTNNGGGMVANPANQLNTLAQPVNFATPPPPNPPPPNSGFTPPACGAGSGLSGLCMVPGTYGNISLTSHTTLNFAPGVYNINSISLAGHAAIDVETNPPGQVILNIAGNGIAAGNAVVDLTGGTVSNPTGIANDFQIMYGGTGTVKVAGGSATYMVVYAPKAAVTLKGGSDFYGAILGYGVNDAGGVNFHYDRNTKLTTVPSNAPLTMISYRDVNY